MKKNKFYKMIRQKLKVDENKKRKLLLKKQQIQKIKQQKNNSRKVIFETKK